MRKSISQPPRRIRDEQYKQGCIAQVETFLHARNYPLRPNSLSCPSSKEFQSIFKFIFSEIETFQFVKFEDEVILILKILKYPFQNEINKSQLVAITPHTWPSVLAMLAWLVGIVESRCEENVTVESLFFDFLCNGFLKFCLGESDASEHEFESATRSLLAQELERTDFLRKEIEKLEDDLQKLREKASEVESLKNKKNALALEKETIAAQRARLEEKNRKYVASMESYKKELNKSEEVIFELQNEEKNLREKIEAQEISPEEVKKMNFEKISLLREIQEKLPKRENLAKSVFETQSLFAELLEDAERLLGDLRGIVDVDLSISQNGEIFGNIDEVEIFIDNLISEKKNLLCNNIEEHERLKEVFDQVGNSVSEAELKIKVLNDRLYKTGKHYIDRKEAFEYEKTESLKGMEKLENELMKLKMVSNRSLISAQQNLQQSKIMSDRVQQAMDYENEEIQNIISVFVDKMEEQIKVRMQIVENIMGGKSK